MTIADGGMRAHPLIVAYRKNGKRPGKLENLEVFIMLQKILCSFVLSKGKAENRVKRSSFLLALFLHGLEVL